MTNKISLAIEQGQKPSIGRRPSNEPLNAFLVYSSDSDGETKKDDNDFNDTAYDYGKLRRTVSVPDMNTHPPKQRTFSICDLDDNVSPISPLNHSVKHPRRNSVALKFQSPKMLTS